MNDGAAESGAGAPLSGAVRLGLPPSRLRQSYPGQAQPTPAPSRLRSCGAPQDEGEGFAFGGGGGNVDWEEVRRLYELTGTPVSAIRERFGLTAWAFRKARVAGNWTTRAQVARPGALQGHKPLGEEAIDFRLNRLVAVGIDVLEKRAAEEGFDEQSARTLRELCRAQEIRMRSKRTEKAAKAREKKNNNGGADFRDDPEWLLAEINRRLDRLAEGSGAEAARSASARDTGDGRGGEA